MTIDAMQFQTQLNVDNEALVKRPAARMQTMAQHTQEVLGKYFKSVWIASKCAAID